MNYIYVIYGMLGALLLAHVTAATTATIVVLRDKRLERFQLFSKILASWILLYVGPLFILYVMNEHSPELVPKFAQKGPLHFLFFAPIKPQPHHDNPVGHDGGYYQYSDASDLGVGGEGSCGAGGD
jgi:hypothetical protein